jgi:hypothetical protein
MLGRQIMWISKKKYEAEKKESYEYGLGIGYNLGYMMGTTDESNKNLGNIVDKQIKEILDWKK